MEDSLKNILFAYDLIYSVFLRRSVTWQPMKDTAYFKSFMQSTFFDENIGRTVTSFISLTQDEVVDVYTKFQNFSGDSVEMFSSLVLGSLPCHFPKGYDPEDFLFFCALMCGVAAYLVTSKQWIYGDLASEIISIVLTTFTLTREFQEKGGFEGLSKYCEKFLRRFHESEITADA